MKNLSIFEPQIEKHDAYKKTCSSQTIQDAADYVTLTRVFKNFFEIQSVSKSFELFLYILLYNTEYDSCEPLNLWITSLYYVVLFLLKEYSGLQMVRSKTNGIFTWNMFVDRGFWYVNCFVQHICS